MVPIRAAGRDGKNKWFVTFPLRDKIVLITGASSGIGRALAVACARRGAKVSLAARSEGRLLEVEKLARESGGEAMVVPTDVTNGKDVRLMVEKTLEKWGRIDALVNNAGFGVWGSFDQLPLDVVRKNFETNCFAPVVCSQAVIPHLRKQGGGLIVNVESVVALRSMPLASCYSATKHALHAFSESMRMELAADRIRVLSVCPGLIDSEFHQNRVDVGCSVSHLGVGFFSNCFLVIVGHGPGDFKLGMGCPG